MTPVPWFVTCWRWLVSHIAVAVDFAGRAVTAVLDLDVQPAPTATIVVVSPTGQIYAGDEVTVRVDLTPTGGTITSFQVDGADVAANADGTYTFPATLPAA